VLVITKEQMDLYVEQYADVKTETLMDISDKLRSDCLTTKNNIDAIQKEVVELERVMRGKLITADIFDAVVKCRLQKKDMEDIAQL